MHYCRLLGAILSGVLAVSAFHNNPGFYIQDYDSYPEQSQLDPSTSEEAELRHDPDFPGRHPPKPKPTNETIFTVLSTNPEFSRLYKVVNISEEIVSLLNDPSTNLTFFAVPNHAIPKRPPRHEHPGVLSSFSPQQSFTLVDLVSIVESTAKEGSVLSEPPSNEQIKKFVTAILSYHIIPQRLGLAALALNTTYPTNLSHVFGALNNESLRLRFELALPFPRVNFYSEVVKPNIGATNGFIHVINHPLLPPPSVFQTAFFLQRGFSIFTSAIQRTDLTNAVDYKFVPQSGVGSSSVEGSPIVTAFVPSNRAFLSLPRDLQFFLFSPVGERALKKLLQFHIVPDIALYTDLVLNSTSNAILDQTEGLEMDPDSSTHSFQPPEMRIIGNYTLPTALEGESLEVLIIKVPIRLPPRKGREIGYVKRIIVNGQHVAAYDGVALNGVSHVVDRLIRPRDGGKGGDHHSTSSTESSDWEGWKEWLPALGED